MKNMMKKMLLLSLVMGLSMRTLSAEHVTGAQEKGAPVAAEKNNARRPHHHHSSSSSSSSSSDSSSSSSSDRSDERDERLCCERMSAELDHVDAVAECTGNATVCIAKLLRDYFIKLNTTGTAQTNFLFGQLTALVAEAQACATATDTCIDEVNIERDRCRDRCSASQRECRDECRFDESDCFEECSAIVNPIEREECFDRCEAIERECTDECFRELDECRDRC